MELSFVRSNKIKPLLDFYEEHSTDMLLDPTTNIIKPERESFVVLDGGKIIGATSVEPLTNHLVKLHSSLVHTDYRGRGVGRFMNQEIEKHLKSEGYGKVVGNVYTNNLANLILKLKMGYIIEGTLRDHDYIGQHEYIISKLL